MHCCAQAILYRYKFSKIVFVNYLCFCIICFHKCFRQSYFWLCFPFKFKAINRSVFFFYKINFLLLFGSLSKNTFLQMSLYKCFVFSFSYIRKFYQSAPTSILNLRGLKFPILSLIIFSIIL